MNREILRLAIPNILTNITVPLLSTADTALMGRVSGMHLGAVGLGSMIFNFLYWNMGFLRMSTTGLTAQGFGAKDPSQTLHAMVRSLLIALIIAAGLLAFQYPIGNWGLYLMNVNAEQAPLVAEYFFIRIWGAPANLVLVVMVGWFLGMQNAIYPLILTGCVTGLNILGNFFFVYGMGMDVDGVAWATVIAQYLGVLLALGLFFSRKEYRELLGQFSQQVLLDLQQMGRILNLNKDIFIRTLCLTFVFAFIYSESSKSGPMTLAVTTVLLQFLNWMSYGVDGFAFAAESLVGKYAGATDDNNPKKAIRGSFVWGMGLATGFSLTYLSFGGSLVRVFTDQADVIAATLPFLFWMALTPFLGTPSYIWDGIFVGLTASKSLRNSMILSFVVFFLAYFGSKGMIGENALWLALLLFLAARGAIQWTMYARKGAQLT